MVTGVLRTVAAEKSPPRSASVGTVATWLRALRLCDTAIFRNTCQRSLVMSFGIRRGPPMLPLKFSRAEGGLGWLCPFSENGAAFKAELLNVTAIDPL